MLVNYSVVAYSDVSIGELLLYSYVIFGESEVMMLNLHSIRFSHQGIARLRWRRWRFRSGYWCWWAWWRSWRRRYFSDHACRQCVIHSFNFLPFHFLYRTALVVGYFEYIYRWTPFKHSGFCCDLCHIVNSSHVLSHASEPHFVSYLVCWHKHI